MRIPPFKTMPVRFRLMFSSGILFLILTFLFSIDLDAQSARRRIFAGNGFVTVLVETDGTVRAWGTSTYMSLGDGILQTGRNVPAPQPVPGISRAVDAAVGERHVLILLADGTVMAWGENQECETGTWNPGRPLRRSDSSPPQRTPAAIPGLRNVKQIAAADRISGALLSDGSVWLWGTSRRGLLAHDDFEGPKSQLCAPAPQRVESLHNVKQLVLTDSHGLALQSDGRILAWGKNDVGQLGDGTQRNTGTPVLVSGITNAIAIASQSNRSAALLSDGTVRTWGDNINGGLGDPATMNSDPPGRYHLTPFAVPGIRSAKSIRAGLTFFFVTLADGTLRGWGEGYYGGLGNGSYDQYSASPQTPTGLGPVVDHFIAGRRNYAIRADGTVFGWGPINMNTPSGMKPFSVVPIVVLPAR